MPNLVGIGLSQVPTNSMLGGLAYQSPDHASIKNLDLKNLSQINSEIADTAVDIFIYDTSKDSDGGAWRKRTQHTSWYNETLNTATRGSRREFPAVAVIVAESYKVTIYDGDDPDLPMWMEWTDCNLGSAKLITAVEAKNGIVVWTTNDTTANGSALYEWNFIAETEYIFGWYNITRKTVGNPFLSRTSERSYVDVTYRGIILNSPLNDVAMTVLPNAPIDPSTGLPIPTIAVATDGGVSIIKDDGTVVDWSTLNNEAIKITSDKIYTSYGVNGRIYVDPIPTLDLANYGGGQSSGVERHYRNTLASSLQADDDLYFLGYSSDNNSVISASSFLVRDTDEISVGTGGGLTNISENPTSPANGLVAYATTSYNTGWMHGDIKGAFLSGISTASVTGSELVTNGTFDSDSDWTKDASWTISAGKATNSGSGNIYQTIAVESGKRYVMSATFDFTGTSTINNTSWGFRQLNNGAYYASYSSWTPNAVNSGVVYWTSTVTGNILARCYSDEGVSIDNWSVREALEEDRSVNNKGLQVFGTITKSAVATGAELVAYGPFSSSNYLYQPYNTDFDFGTGNFSIMFWVKSTDTGYVFWRNDTTNTPFWDIYVQATNNLRFRLGADQRNVTSGVDTTQWTFVCFARSGSTVSAYVNGEIGVTYTDSGDITNADAPLYIGRRVGSSSELTAGYVSLMRISGSAPSAEQIKKIYEDEKVLFQENSKCTLYGTSSAVTALAYDDSTSILYAGTSSGRSDFQGLCRINNTTTAVTTAMSASNGLVAEQ